MISASSFLASLQKNIEVTVLDGMLTVQGEKHFQQQELGLTYFFSEREYGAFQRSFRLPPDAAKDRISAAFKNGVLTLRIGKQQPAAGETQKITVRSE